ncbi:uncharacterized protein LOC144000825 [Festucalex cinctus]
MYVAVGDPLTLRPQLRGPIRSIEWRRGRDLLAEWDGSDVTRYDDRITLNVSNAELVIDRATAADTNVFTLALNAVTVDDSFNVKVIRRVPKPEVHSSPLACTADKQELHNCTLHCGGDTSGAGPVTYFWITEPGGKIQEGRNRSIDRTNSAPKSFFCAMENPLGREQSQPFSNPFYKDEPGPGPGEITAVVLGVVLFLALVTLAYWLYRRNRRNRGTGAISEADGNNLEAVQPLAK